MNWKSERPVAARQAAEASATPASPVTSGKRREVSQAVTRTRIIPRLRMRASLARLLQALPRALLEAARGREGSAIDGGGELRGDGAAAEGDPGGAGRARAGGSAGQLVGADEGDVGRRLEVGDPGVGVPGAHELEPD